MAVSDFADVSTLFLRLNSAFDGDEPNRVSIVCLCVEFFYVDWFLTPQASRLIAL